jgi:hypothetical protein
VISNLPKCGTFLRVVANHGRLPSIRVQPCSIVRLFAVSAIHQPHGLEFPSSLDAVGGMDMLKMAEMSKSLYFIERYFAIP